MTGFDYAVLVVLAASVLLGAWRGLVNELLALAAWVVGFFISQAYAESVGRVFDSWFAEPAIQYVLGFVLIFVLVLLSIALVRLAVSKILRSAGLGGTDRMLGSLFGVLRGCLVIFIVVLVCGLTQLPQRSWWREAWFSPPFEMMVLAVKPWLPDALAKRIRYRA